MWLLRIQNVAIEDEELDFYFIFINNNLNSDRYVVATILDSSGVVCTRYNMYKRE